MGNSCKYLNFSIGYGDENVHICFVPFSILVTILVSVIFSSPFKLLKFMSAKEMVGEGRRNSRHLKTDLED